MRSLPVEIAGEAFTLHAERGAFWQREGTLFVADIHLGKAAAFRRAGIPIPHGTTEDDLARLGTLLDETGARRLVILGDLLHAASGRAPRTLDHFTDWRESRTALEILLVRGNHDLKSGPLPEEWNIQEVEDPTPVGPILCAHHAVKSEKFVFHGHVHPKVTVQSGARGGALVPCFVLDVTSLVFPAFGVFTGGHRVQLRRGVRHFALVDGGIYSLQA